MSEVDEKEKAIGEPLGAVSGPAVNLSEMPTAEATAKAREESLGSRVPEKPLVKLKVTFMPMNVVHEIDANETVLHLAQRHDIHIQSVCKGLPSCAECRVCIKEGEHHVPPPSSKELSLIGTAHYIDRSRLSCQLRCYGDIVVDLTEQMEKATRVAKQPQGRASRKEGEVSHAVKGNIIEDFNDDSGPVEQIAPTEERPGHDSFYEEPKKNQNQRQNQNKGGNQNNNRNRNNRGGGGNQRGEGRGESRAQGGGQGPRNNNRGEGRGNGGGGNPRSAGGNQSGGNPNHNRGGRGTGNQGGPRNNSGGGGSGSGGGSRSGGSSGGSTTVESRPRPMQAANPGENQGQNPGSSRPQPRKNPENNG